MNKRYISDLILTLVAFLLAAGALYLSTTSPAFAGGKQPVSEQEQKQSQKQGQHQGQKQYQSAKAVSDSDSRAVSESDSTSSAASSSVSKAAGGSASNEGNSLSVSSNVEAPAPDVVLVPGQQIINCGTVLGVGGSNKDGSFVLGIPLPDRFLWVRQGADCNLDRAASDARADGNRPLAWYFSCQKPSLYRTFRDRGEKREKMIADCIEHTVGASNLQAQNDALRSQLQFIQNERVTEREHARNQLNQARSDCAESNRRALEACVSK